jgi:hypothetical protein
MTIKRTPAADAVAYFEERAKIQAVADDIKRAIDTYELALKGAKERKEWTLCDIYEERLGNLEGRLLRLNSELFA